SARSALEAENASLKGSLGKYVQLSAVIHSLTGGTQQGAGGAVAGAAGRSAEPATEAAAAPENPEHLLALGSHWSSGDFASAAPAVDVAERTPAPSRVSPAQWHDSRAARADPATPSARPSSSPAATGSTTSTPT